MLRRLIAILLTVYAIAFAFGALTAVRWPSIMMALSWVVQEISRPVWRAWTGASSALLMVGLICSRRCVSIARLQ